MDDGYYDMYKIMEALVEVDFDGIVIPDHIPERGVCRDRRAVVRPAGIRDSIPAWPTPSLT